MSFVLFAVLLQTGLAIIFLPTTLFLWGKQKCESKMITKDFFADLNKIKNIFYSILGFRHIYCFYLWWSRWTIAESSLLLLFVFSNLLGIAFSMRLYLVPFAIISSSLKWRLHTLKYVWFSKSWCFDMASIHSCRCLPCCGILISTENQQKW